MMICKIVVAQNNAIAKQMNLAVTFSYNQSHEFLGNIVMGSKNLTEDEILNQTKTLDFIGK